MAVCSRETAIRHAIIFVDLYSDTRIFIPTLDVILWLAGVIFTVNLLERQFTLLADYIDLLRDFPTYKTMLNDTMWVIDSNNGALTCNILSLTIK